MIRENLKYCIGIVNDFIDKEIEKIKHYGKNIDRDVKLDILYYKQIKSRINEMTI